LFVLLSFFLVLTLVQCANVRVFARRVLEDHGAVSVLVNNAGVMLNPEQETMLCSAEDVQRSMAVNCVAPMLLMQAFAPGMEKTG
jgi:NAD(P)-dependent dehydrogenase (short-subunit alcohol dehydrogenase family)